MDSNYSLADIRAATEGEDRDGFGGGWMWIIVLFIFMFGFGGGGFGNRAGGALSMAEMQQGFDNASVDRRLNQISNGICDSTFALNNSILTEGRALQTQMATCCCDTNRNIDAVRYEAAQNTCAITTAIHAEGEQTRALITENTIQNLRDKVADLQLAQSQCAQNAYLVGQLRPYPIPTYQYTRTLRRWLEWRMLAEHLTD